jgi:HlyD family secretion protein
VVTYTVIVKAPNPDLRLMPGLTADITIYVEEAKDVLTISSKALHFTPDQNIMGQYMMQAMKNSKDATPPAGMEPPKNTTPSADGASGMAAPDSTKPTVWVKNGPMIHPVNVSIGIDDDLNAQIISGLKEGDEVVTSMKASTVTFAAQSSSGGSPFMPKPPSNNSSRSAAKK